MRQLGTVTIHRTYYLLDDVHDGDHPYDDVWTEKLDAVTASEAADILTRAGLTFAATGGSWAADPDGSYTVDYALGKECETSGHLDGFPDRLADAIQRKVG